MAIKGIIFDCDGTLVDSELLCHRALVMMLEHYGAVESEDRLLREFRGGKLADILNEMERRHGITLKANFVEQYRAQVEIFFSSDLRPTKGVRELLAKIDLPMCVASSGPAEKIRRALEISGIQSFFGKRVFSSYAINSWKPEPDLFLHAAWQLGLRPNECLVVEDSALGIVAANRAGMEACLFDSHGVVSVTEDNRYTRLTDMADVLDIIATPTSRL